MVLGVVHRVVGVLHRILGVPQMVLGVLGLPVVPGLLGTLGTCYSGFDCSSAGLAHSLPLTGDWRGRVRAGVARAAQVARGTTQGTRGTTQGPRGTTQGPRCTKQGTRITTQGTRVTTQGTRVPTQGHQGPGLRAPSPEPPPHRP